MTPEGLREKIRTGRYTASDERIWNRNPAPPPEWRSWKAGRTKAQIRAAMLFLAGKLWHEIADALAKERLLMARGKREDGHAISRARVGQYVRGGVKFLLDRGYFVPVKKVK